MVIVSPDFTSVSYELWRRMCDIVIQEVRHAAPLIQRSE